MGAQVVAGVQVSALVLSHTISLMATDTNRLLSFAVSGSDIFALSGVDHRVYRRRLDQDELQWRRAQIYGASAWTIDVVGSRAYCVGNDWRILQAAANDSGSWELLSGQQQQSIY